MNLKADKQDMKDTEKEAYPADTLPALQGYPEPLVWAAQVHAVVAKDQAHSAMVGLATFALATTASNLATRKDRVLTSRQNADTSTAISHF